MVCLFLWARQTLILLYKKKSTPFPLSLLSSLPGIGKRTVALSACEKNTATKSMIGCVLHVCMYACTTSYYELLLGRNISAVRVNSSCWRVDSLTEQKKSQRNAKQLHPLTKNKNGRLWRNIIQCRHPSFCTLPPTHPWRHLVSNISISPNPDIPTKHVRISPSPHRHNSRNSRGYYD